MTGRDDGVDLAGGLLRPSAPAASAATADGTATATGTTTGTGTAALGDQAMVDLGLDRLLAPAIADAPWLAEAYTRPCGDPATIDYRQAVAAQLIDRAIAAPFERFLTEIRRLQQRLEATIRVTDAVARTTWFLAAAERYLAAVAALHEAIAPLELTAEGLVAARERVATLVASDAHRAVAQEAAAIRAQLDDITFTVRVQGGRVTVDRLQGEPDLAAQVAATFARFRTGQATPIEPSAPEPGSDKVTARILALVAAQHPEPFARLATLYERAQPLIAPEISQLVAELPFYLGVLPQLRRLSDAGLPLSYPTVVAHDAACSAEASYDLAVGLSLLSEGEQVVTNDWYLDPPERILVVTGANQGGKTTFARAFAQLHHLGAIGLPVPAAQATVGLHDRLRTHFERQEQLTTLRGKLQDELERMHAVLIDATDHSVVVLNETFSSTTLEDARSLGRTFLERLTTLGARVVYVTFVDELATTAGSVVSMVAGVAEDDPTRRTFRIVRRPPDGLAHALALAERYGLSEDALRRRFGS